MSDDNAKSCPVCSRNEAKTLALVREIYRDLQTHLDRGVLESEPLWRSAAWLGHAILNDERSAERIANFVETQLPQEVSAFVLTRCSQVAEREDDTLH